MNTMLSRQSGTVGVYGFPVFAARNRDDPWRDGRRLVLGSSSATSPAMSHNTFGHLFRVTTWGESHGPALG
jgi:chorismate synthase